MKKTAISSVVCLEIIDFAKKSEAEQQAAKQQLQARIEQAIVDIPEKDRVVVETDAGAIINCSGPLESALEDALFIALTIRDEILNINTDSQTPLYLLMAINLGTVRTSANKANGKVEGEGLLEAQQIMSFANPNQILVSRAYYDMASKLTLEVAQMFEKYDMHAYEHDIYAVRRLNEKSVVENAAAALDHLERPQEEAPVAAATFNWHLYFLPALLALIMLFVLFKWMQHDEAGNVATEPGSFNSAVEQTSDFDVDVLQDPLPEIPPQPELELEPMTEVAKEKPQTTKKQAVKKQEQPDTVDDVEEAEAVVDSYDEPVVETTVEVGANEDKSTWDTIKDSVTTGTGNTPCSQAQKAMNQCN